MHNRCKKQRTHLMHVGVHKNLKGPDCQGDIGRCGGDGEDIVKGLLPHVVSVDGLHQIATGNGHHGRINGKLQFPCAELGVGVHAGEPESEGGVHQML